jgi:hypothetical protein
MADHWMRFSLSASTFGSVECMLGIAAATNADVDSAQIAGRRVLPLQPVADHEDDAAHNPPVIDPRNRVRQRKNGDIHTLWRSLSRNKSPFKAPYWRP